MEFKLESSSEPITIPKQFGNWAFIELLGNGATSAVVLAQNTKTKEKAACKFISRAQIIKDKILQNVEQELRIIQSIHHPGLCSILDILYLKDSIVICMEYCELGSIYDYVAKNGPLQYWELRPIVKRILETISYLHEKGIAHRDIKLENIVLTKDFQPKLIDFGICTEKNIFSLKDESCPNIRTTQCGTCYYMPPEVILNRCYDPYAVDIWEFGIVLYALAVGEFPWNGTSKQITQQICSATFQIPQFVHPTIKKMIEGSIVLDPKRRTPAKKLSEMIEILPHPGVPKASSCSGNHQHKFIIINPRNSILSKSIACNLRRNMIPKLCQ